MAANGIGLNSCRNEDGRGVKLPTMPTGSTGSTSTRHAEEMYPDSVILPYGKNFF